MKGCRVLDLGIITAGAATSAILADLGAEVIKIESPSYKDAFRDWVTAPPRVFTSRFDRSSSRFTSIRVEGLSGEW